MYLELNPRKLLLLNFSLALLCVWQSRASLLIAYLLSRK